MHSVKDDVVGLSLPHLAEVQFVDYVICAVYFGRANNCTNHPDLPT